MNDSISKMTEKELFDACKEVLGRPGIFDSTHLFGHVMSMLCEWGVSFERKAETKVYRLYKDDVIFFGICVLSVFLRVAIALNKWEAPKAKEEPEFAHFLTHEGSVLSITLGLGNNTDISYLTEGRGFKRVRVSPWEEK